MSLDLSVLNVLDVVILALLIGSTLMSLFRGFVKELLALLGWIVAVVAARQLTPMGAEWLQQTVELERTTATVIAAVSIIVICRVLFGILSLLLRFFVKAAKISLADRVLGTVFGFFRGGLIVLLCIMVGKEFELIYESELWEQSFLLPKLSVFDEWFSEFMHSIWEQRGDITEDAKAVFERSVEQSIEAVKHGLL